MILKETIEEHIARLEKLGEIDPTCKMCVEIFYPLYRKGLFNVYAPRHKAMPHCKSSKHPHCTCDSCF